MNNRNNKKRLTPRQRQILCRKFGVSLSAIILSVILSVFVGGLFNKAKAADNYYKYYTSVSIMPGDTISDYFLIYGENYKSSSDYIEEVCMINSIDSNDLKAGNYIILPYYSTEIK